MGFEIPLRHPETLGEALERDLALCGNALDASVDGLRDRVRTALTTFRQKTALSELASARALQQEPFFGWLVVTELGERKRLRVGAAPYPELRIVDWRHPLAQVYYSAEMGSEYERPTARGMATGTLMARARITHEARRINQARWEDAQGVLEIVRDAEDGGRFSVGSVVAGRLPSGLPNILGYLTPRQYALISRATNRPLIIQGRAGSGKTTVALHRLSWLAFPGEDGRKAPLEPSRVLIVMFNRALCSFVSELLEPLGLEDASLRTFHSWALRTVRDVYGGDLEIGSASLPDQQEASALKAQLGMLEAVERYVASQTARLVSWLEGKLEPYDGGSWLERFRSAPDEPPVRRLIALRRGALAARDGAKNMHERQRLDQIYRIFRRGVLRMSLYKEDLHRLLTDTHLLASCLPGIGDDQLQALGRYQNARQLGEDGRVGATVDFDDLALILRIMQVKHGGLPTADEQVFHFDHLMIDEAQDFGAVQLQVLLDAVKTRSGVTIVGDVNQKILPGAHFIGWAALAEQLGLDGSHVAQLEIGHRSTAPIVAVADTIVGQKPSSGRTGPVPRDVVTDSEDESFTRLAEMLRERMTESPHAHLCVVCGRRSHADSAQERLVKLLGSAPFNVRLGHNRDFVFAPGVTVTNKHQVKGLEFDSVYVLDPTPEFYPDTEQGRRDLYVVTSRAQHRLAFVGHTIRSPLIEALVEASLVQRSEPAFDVVSFDDEDADVPF